MEKRLILLLFDLHSIKDSNKTPIISVYHVFEIPDEFFNIFAVKNYLKTQIRSE